MTKYGPYILLIFIATALTGVVTTWLSIKLSHLLKIYDIPEGRKSHRTPVPYLGGLGMLLSFLMGLVYFALLFPGMVFLEFNTFLAIITCSMCIFLVGFTDDIKPIRAVVKLFLQIAVASLAWTCGLRVEGLSLLDVDAGQLGMFLSYAVTVGWYVALMNSINLVDGLDGLAGGICFIGALSLVGIGFFFPFDISVLIGMVLAVVTAGSCLGYLRWNWHPAKTFMGDSGSLLLGFLLGTASIVGSTKTSTLLALAVPMIALGLPLFETGFSFLRRAIKGQSPFKPDRRHLHHRLLDLGLDQQRVVLLLLFFTAFLGLNSILMANTQSEYLFFNVVFLILGIILMIENVKFLERQRASQELSLRPPSPSEATEPDAPAPVSPAAPQQSTTPL